MRLLKSIQALYVAHLLGYTRSRTAIYWSLAFPLFFLFIFGYVFGRGKTADIDYLMPGLLTITTISGSFFGVAMRIVTERETGVLRRLRLTPVPALAVVAAHALTALTVLLASLAVQVTVARLAFHFTVKGSPLGLFAVLAMGGLALIPIGLVAGSVARDSKTAPAINTAAPARSATLNPWTNASFAFSTRLSGVTSAPSSKRSSALTLIGAVDVRNGPIGIASLEVAPRCLPSRM